MSIADVPVNDGVHHPADRPGASPPSGVVLRGLLACFAVGIACLMAGCAAPGMSAQVTVPVPECRGQGDHPKTRAADCVTGAVYEIARKNGEKGSR